MLHEKTIDLDGNIIHLVETKYNSETVFASYYRWNGVYKIASSSFPVTQNDVNRLLQTGIFGYGQLVTATLIENSQEIIYEGSCDHGD